MAFSDAFDIAFNIERDIEDIMKYYIPVSMHTDSSSLFNDLTKSYTTRRKLLMINLQTFNNPY